VGQSDLERKGRMRWSRIKFMWRTRIRGGDYPNEGVYYVWNNLSKQVEIKYNQWWKLLEQFKGNWTKPLETIIKWHLASCWFLEWNP
jgi:hypothetical protein